MNELNYFWLPYIMQKLEDIWPPEFRFSHRPHPGSLSVFARTECQGKSQEKPISEDPVGRKLTLIFRTLNYIDLTLNYIDLTLNYIDLTLNYMQFCFLRYYLLRMDEFSRKAQGFYKLWNKLLNGLLPCHRLDIKMPRYLRHDTIPRRFLLLYIYVFLIVHVHSWMSLI